MAVKRFALFLYEAARKKGNWAWLFLGAALTGVMQALILMELMHAVDEFVNKGKVPPFSYFFFVGALIVYALAYWRSTTVSLDIAQEFITISRERIARGIAGARYQEFRELNRTEIYGALSANAALITEGARFMPNCIAASVLLLFAMLYAASVSLAGTLALACMFLAVVWAFRRMERQNREFRNEYSLAEGSFMSGLEDLFNGFVELKMNQEKRERFLGDKLLRYSGDADRNRRKYESVNMRGNALYAILNYLPSGIIAFALPHLLTFNAEDILRLIAVSMFATPALVNLAMFEPLTSQSMDTIDAIDSVIARLDRIADVASERQTLPAFERQLVISGVAFTYAPAGAAGVRSDGAPWREERDVDGKRVRHVRVTDPDGSFKRWMEGECARAAGTPNEFTIVWEGAGEGRGGFEKTEFSLTAEHFTLNRGEILFLYGGNGNGKTTFCRLVCGLLPMQTGEDGAPLGSIAVDGRLVAPGELPDYRRLFSVVFSDFHLFKSLDNREDVPRARELLKKMGLDAKVTVSDEGDFSTIDLSTGQRKRLALLCAILEGERDLGPPDKQGRRNGKILVLDEVAADFDPGFRKTYYREILPELKKKGFTILAISHDDTYLDCADRTVRVGEDRRVEPNPEIAP